MKPTIRTAGSIIEGVEREQWYGHVERIRKWREDAEENNKRKPHGRRQRRRLKLTRDEESDRQCVQGTSWGKINSDYRRKWMTGVGKTLLTDTMIQNNNDTWIHHINSVYSDVIIHVYVLQPLDNRQVIRRLRTIKPYRLVLEVTVWLIIIKPLNVHWQGNRSADFVKAHTLCYT